MVGRSYLFPKSLKEKQKKVSISVKKKYNSPSYTDEDKHYILFQKGRSHLNMRYNIYTHIHTHTYICV